MNVCHDADNLPIVATLFHETRAIEFRVIQEYNFMFVLISFADLGNIPARDMHLYFVSVLLFQHEVFIFIKSFGLVLLYI